MARKVLLGLTQGYRHHPQLERFRAVESPIAAIEYYLHHVVDEADKRGFRFDRTKLGPRPAEVTLDLPSGQLTFEREHLKRKLDIRDVKRGRELPEAISITVHPMFRVMKGGICQWEKP